MYVGASGQSFRRSKTEEARRILFLSCALVRDVGNEKIPHYIYCLIHGRHCESSFIRSFAAVFDHLFPFFISH